VPESVVTEDQQVRGGVGGSPQRCFAGKAVPSPDVAVAIARALKATVAEQQALTLYQQLGKRDGQAAAWDSLGYAHHHLGQHAQATTCYQHALTLVRDPGDRYNEATGLTHLGDTHQAAGNPQAARDAWQQALIILDDFDHPDAAQIRVKLTDLGPPIDQRAE
jgi:tetratricopeptide (TPR) repeat protein